MSCVIRCGRSEQQRRVSIRTAIAAATAGIVALAVCPSAAATPPPVPTLAVIAGTGASGVTAAGPATSTTLASPAGVAVDASGNVYIADRSNNVVDKVTPAGTLSIFAGTGSAGAPTPGPATSSALNVPAGVAVDASGNVYIADEISADILKVTPGGTLTVIAGINSNGAPTPGPATSSRLHFPVGVAVDASGNVYIADAGNNDVEKVDVSGTLSVIAGMGTSGAPTPGPATGSHLNSPSSVAVDSGGNVYIADSGNYDVEKVDVSGTLSVIAGVGSVGSPAAGSATSSHLNAPYGVALDTAGNVYIADTYHSRIDEVSTSGILSFLAGNGTVAAPVAGVATGSPLDLPYGLTVDTKGNVYIADTFNHVVEKVTVYALVGAPIGVSAVAGNGGAMLSWSAPLSDGNSAITGYRYSTDNGVTWSALTYTGTGPFSATITGLSNGSTFPIKIQAVNAYGGGAASVGVSVTPTAPPVTAPPVTTPPVTTPPISTPPSPTPPPTPVPVPPLVPVSRPTAPSRVRVAPSDGALTVIFTPAKPAPGSRITGYQVSLNGGHTWSTQPTSGTTRLSVTITGLSDGVTYHVGVRAITNHGARIATATNVTVTMPTAWYVDPIVNRAGETPVPGNPAAYRGPLSATAATARSANGGFAVPISWTVGRHLSAHEAATLTGDGLFGFDSAALTAAGAAQLRQLVASLSGDRSITCEGYSDYGNKVAHETALSLARAQAVCGALRSYGARTVTLSVGYGATFPVLIGGIPADRAANRRVVIYVNS